MIKSTEVKKVLKKAGYNVKDFSVNVRFNSNNADTYIKVTVKNALLKIKDIKILLESKYEKIDYDERTYEILQGANTFVLVQYDLQAQRNAISNYIAKAEKILSNLNLEAFGESEGKVFCQNKEYKIFIFPQKEMFSLHTPDGKSEWLRLENGYGLTQTAAHALLIFDQLTA